MFNLDELNSNSDLIGRLRAYIAHSEFTSVTYYMTTGVVRSFTDAGLELMAHDAKLIEVNFGAAHCISILTGHNYEVPRQE